MITWWGILIGFVFGFVALVLALEFGWLLQRAGDGRGRGRVRGEVASTAPPYDWAKEPDL